MAWLPECRGDACVARAHHRGATKLKNPLTTYLARLCSSAILLYGGALHPTPQATPEPQPAAACDVAARSPAEIAGLLAAPGIATPAATTGGQTLPAGNPVDAATAAAMERIVLQWLACQNAGAPLQAWTLFSDGYLYRLLSRQGMPDVAPDATPATGSDGGAKLLDIRGQRVLPDGRYGATVTVTYPSVPAPKTFFFFFTTVEGRLRIDGILGEISFSVP